MKALHLSAPTAKLVGGHKLLSDLNCMCRQEKSWICGGGCVSIVTNAGECPRLLSRCCKWPDGGRGGGGSMVYAHAVHLQDWGL